MTRPPGSASDRGRRAAQVGSAMRIVWVHSHLLLWTGGTKYVVRAAAELARSHDVTVVADRASPLVRELLARDGVPLVEVSRRLSSMDRAYWLLFPLVVWNRRRALARLSLKPDLFVT